MGTDGGLAEALRSARERRRQPRYLELAGNGRPQANRVLYAAFLFFILGGIEALLIRIQLIVPESDFLNPDQYNRIFTMHGTTMVFLVVMPLSAAFFNLMVPLMIGARDVAFPRLNAFSYWTFLAGGIFLNASFFTGGNIFQGELGAPDSGWFGYSTLTSTKFSAGHGVDFWILGLQTLA